MADPFLREEDIDRLATHYERLIGRWGEEGAQQGLYDVEQAGWHQSDAYHGYIRDRASKEGVNLPGRFHDRDNFLKAKAALVDSVADEDTRVNNWRILKRAHERSREILANQQTGHLVGKAQYAEALANPSFDPGWTYPAALLKGLSLGENMPVVGDLLRRGAGAVAGAVGDFDYGEHREEAERSMAKARFENGAGVMATEFVGSMIPFLATMHAAPVLGAKGSIPNLAWQGAFASTLLADTSDLGWSPGDLGHSLGRRAVGGAVGGATMAAGAGAGRLIERGLTQYALREITSKGLSVAAMGGEKTVAKAMRRALAHAAHTAGKYTTEAAAFTAIEPVESLIAGHEIGAEYDMDPWSFIGMRFLLNLGLMGGMRALRGSRLLGPGRKAYEDMEARYAANPVQAWPELRNAARGRGSPFDAFEVEVAWQRALRGLEMDPMRAAAIARRPELILGEARRLGLIPESHVPTTPYQEPSTDAAGGEAEPPGQLTAYYGGNAYRGRHSLGPASENGAWGNVVRVSDSPGVARQHAERHKGPEPAIHEVRHPSDLNLLDGAFPPSLRELRVINEVLRPMEVGLFPRIPGKEGVAREINQAFDAARQAGASPEQLAQTGNRLTEAVKALGYDGVSRLGGRLESNDYLVFDPTLVEFQPPHLLGGRLPLDPKPPMGPEPLYGPAPSGYEGAGRSLPQFRRAPVDLTPTRPEPSAPVGPQQGPVPPPERQIELGFPLTKAERTRYEMHADKARAAAERAEYGRMEEIQGAQEVEMGNLRRLLEPGTVTEYILRNNIRLPVDAWLEITGMSPEATGHGAMRRVSRAAKIRAIRESGVADKWILPAKEEAGQARSFDTIMDKFGLTDPGELLPHYEALSRSHPDATGTYLSKKGKPVQYRRRDAPDTKTEAGIGRWLSKLEAEARAELEAVERDAPGRIESSVAKSARLKLADELREARRWVESGREAEYRRLKDERAPEQEMMGPWDEGYVEPSGRLTELQAQRPPAEALALLRARDAMMRMAPEGSPASNALERGDVEAYRTALAEHLAHATGIRPEARINPPPDPEIHHSFLSAAGEALLSRFNRSDAATRYMQGRGDGSDGPRWRPSWWMEMLPGFVKKVPMAFRQIERTVQGRLPPEVARELPERMGQGLTAMEVERHTNLGAIGPLRNAAFEYLRRQSIPDQHRWIRRVAKMRVDATGADGLPTDMPKPLRDYLGWLMEAAVRYPEAIRQLAKEEGLSAKFLKSHVDPFVTDPAGQGILFSDSLLGYLADLAGAHRRGRGYDLPDSFRNADAVSRTARKHGPESFYETLDLITDGFVTNAARAKHMQPFAAWWERTRQRLGEDVATEYLDWFQGDVDIAMGSLPRWEKPLQRAGQRFVDALVKRHPSLQWLQRSDVGAGAMLRFYVFNNYAGALGINPASPLANITQNLSTFAELVAHETGTPARRAAKVTQRMMKYASHPMRMMRFSLDQNRVPELHPKQLLLNLGIADMSLHHSIRDLAKVSLSDAAGPTLMRQYRRMVEVLLMGFQASEIFNRGVAGLAAYEQALERGLPRSKAESYARRIVRRTQFDYRKGLGGRAYAGPVGHFLFQFGRFPNYQMDFLASLWQRAYRGDFTEMGREGATFLPFAAYALGGFGFFQLLRQAIGIDIDEIHGPAAGIGEPFKVVASASGQAAARLGALATGQSPHAAEERAREVMEGIGVAPWRDDVWEGLMQAFGPGVQQARSVGDLVHQSLAGDDRTRRRAWRNLVRNFRPTIPGGVQWARVNRFLQERREGFTRARSTGERQFDLSPGGMWGDLLPDEWDRLLGLQPSQMADQVSEYNSVSRLKRAKDAAVQTLNEDVRAILRGDDPDRWEAALAEYLDGWRAIEDEYGYGLTVEALRDRWKALVRNAAAGEAQTKLEKLYRKDKALRDVER